MKSGKGAGGRYSMQEFSQYFEMKGILNLQPGFLTVASNFQNQNEKRVAANQNYFFNKFSMKKNSSLAEQVFHFSTEKICSPARKENSIF